MDEDWEEICNGKVVPNRMPSRLSPVRDPSPRYRSPLVTLYRKRSASPQYGRSRNITPPPKRARSETPCADPNWKHDPVEITLLEPTPGEMPEEMGIEGVHFESPTKITQEPSAEDDNRKVILEGHKPIKETNDIEQNDEKKENGKEKESRAGNDTNQTGEKKKSDGKNKTEQSDEKKQNNEKKQISGKSDTKQNNEKKQSKTNPEQKPCKTNSEKKQSKDNRENKQISEQSGTKQKHESKQGTENNDKRQSNKKSEKKSNKHNNDMKQDSGKKSENLDEQKQNKSDVIITCDTDNVGEVDSEFTGGAVVAEAAVFSVDPDIVPNPEMAPENTLAPSSEDELNDIAEALVKDLERDCNDGHTVMDMGPQVTVPDESGDHRMELNDDTFRAIARAQAQMHYSGATKVTPPLPMTDLDRDIFNKSFSYYRDIHEKRIILNIGGTCFQTSRLTLMADPQSLFGQLMRDDCPFRPGGSNGRTYFFDRDPSHFRFILNYLRNGGHLDASFLPREKRYLLELLCEARFFFLAGLREIILNRLEQLFQSREF